MTGVELAAIVTAASTWLLLAIDNRRLRRRNRQLAGAMRTVSRLAANGAGVTLREIAATATGSIIGDQL